MKTNLHVLQMKRQAKIKLKTKTICRNEESNNNDNRKKSHKHSPLATFSPSVVQSTFASSLSSRRCFSSFLSIFQIIFASCLGLLLFLSIALLLFDGSIAECIRHNCKCIQLARITRPRQIMLYSQMMFFLPQMRLTSALPKSIPKTTYSHYFESPLLDVCPLVFLL